MCHNTSMVLPWPKILPPEGGDHRWIVTVVLDTMYRMASISGISDRAAWKVLSAQKSQGEFPSTEEV